MPLFDYLCADCGRVTEVLVVSASSTVDCPHCGSTKLRKLMSAPSSLSGSMSSALPGTGDTACCGSSPGHAGCAGPGSCCGKI